MGTPSQMTIAVDWLGKSQVEIVIFKFHSGATNYYYEAFLNVEIKFLLKY